MCSMHRQAHGMETFSLRGTAAAQLSFPLEVHALLLKSKTDLNPSLYVGYINSPSGRSKLFIF